MRASDIVSLVRTWLRRRRVAAIVGLIVLTSSAAHATNPPGAPDDHFQCYKASSTSFDGVELDLSDGFGSERFKLVKPAAICPPADKQEEGIFDAVTHLESYRVKLARMTPPQVKPVQRRNLSVQNQFGNIQLDTVKPDRVLIPTSKSLTGPVAPPNDAAHNVDSFKCYKVRVSPGSPKFQSRLVRVADQFEDRLYALRAPKHLCAPAAVNGGPVKRPQGYLTCYSAKAASGQPKHQRRSGVHVANQIGSDTLTTIIEEELCVPSVLNSAGGCNQGVATFDVIQQYIFTNRGCNVSTCHGQFASADLDLRPGSSFVELINVLAAHPNAAALGKKRVIPGNAASSFLSQKLHGTMGIDEGSRMPLIGGPPPDGFLPQVELDLIDAWIDAGAPATGQVEGAPCLPPEEYHAVTPPAVPPGGYQLVLTGPTLQPGQEQEGCLWVPAPNTTNFDVGKWEFVLNPGTHHFSVFEFNRTGAPVTNVWTPNDFGCFSGAQFGNSVSGSPQAPYFVDAYPAGIARRLVAGKYYGLNAHYYNRFDVPIQVKVYVNIYPYSGPTPKLAQTIVEIDDTFSINVPPFAPPSQSIHTGSFVNTTGQPISILSLSSHMHKRGKRFTEWNSSGTKLYENFDFSHPIFRYFTPPMVLAPGDFIDYECQYDNGYTDITKVKRRTLGTPCGANETRCIGGPKHNQLCFGSHSFCDSSPGAGDGDCDACPLYFGVSAEDEMCILAGQYYPGL